MSVGIISGGKYIKTASNFDITRIASETQDGLMSKEDYARLKKFDPDAQGVEVSYEQLITTGTKIGSITINDEKTEIYVPKDDNTTYTFVQDGTTLKITGSDGSYEEITLGGDITSEAVVEALGYTPANEDNIPTALSDLTDDDTHRVVTDAEKAAWNAKSTLTLGETSDKAYPGDKGKINADNIAAVYELINENMLSYELDSTGTGITTKGGFVFPLTPMPTSAEDIDDVFSDTTTDLVSDEEIEEVLN